MHDVKVWDLPTRIFHWSLVVLVVVSWLTAEDKAWIMGRGLCEWIDWKLPQA